MTIRDRLQDISERSGVSIEVVRRVIGAERDSVVASLAKGEKAELVGRVKLLPTIRRRMDIVNGGELELTVKIKAYANRAVEAKVEAEIDENKFAIQDEDESDHARGILAKDIDGVP